MESASTISRDCGSYTAAICWKGMENTGRISRTNCPRMRIGMLNEMLSARRRY